MHGMFKPFGRKKLHEALAPEQSRTATAPDKGTEVKRKAPDLSIPTPSPEPPVAAATGAPSPKPAAQAGQPQPFDVASLKPQGQPVEAGGIGDMTDLFADETDERDQFHKDIISRLENISASSLLQESREIARHMRRMPSRTKRRGV